MKVTYNQDQADLTVTFKCRNSSDALIMQLLVKGLLSELKPQLKPGEPECGSDSASLIEEGTTEDEIES